MQLTRIDRWLLESFVHETHVYTLSAPPSVPKGIREKPLPDTPGQRFQHHFVGNGKPAQALIDLLKTNGQMFTTQVKDRNGWHVPIIAPKGQSFTWRFVWIVFTCVSFLSAGVYLNRLWQKPEVRKNIAGALEILKG